MPIFTTSKKNKQGQSNKNNKFMTAPSSPKKVGENSKNVNKLVLLPILSSSVCNQMQVCPYSIKSNCCLNKCKKCGGLKKQSRLSIKSNSSAAESPKLVANKIIKQPLEAYLSVLPPDSLKKPKAPRHGGINESEPSPPQLIKDMFKLQRWLNCEREDFEQEIVRKQEYEQSRMKALEAK